MKFQLATGLNSTILLSLVTALVSCSEGPLQVAGGGVETETITVSGIFTLPDNTPARGARVSFRSVEFLQGAQTLRTTKVRDTLTDSHGAFQISGLPAGEYALEINRGDSLGWFQRIIPSPKKSNSFQGKLEPFAKVKGYVSLPDSAPEFFIQVYGLGRRFPVNGNGAFTIPLPAGEYVFRLTTESSRYLSLEIPHVLLAPSQDTLLAEISFDDLLPKTPVSVIFENNLSAGLGDAVALAALHALANNGEVRILGMATNSSSIWSGPALDAINTYYRRPNIPIGILKGAAPLPAGTIYGEDRYPYDEFLAKQFPNDANSQSSLPDATELYLRLLGDQPDSSVVIISTGSLENLYNLMIKDSALVALKVKTLVILGGTYPMGLENNFKAGIGNNIIPNTTLGVVERWPTQMVFLGSELGADVLTGSCLEMTSVLNPIRKAAELTLGNAGKSHLNSDLMPVLFAARGLREYFSAIGHGSNSINADGSNIWKNEPVKNHTYLVRKMTPIGLASDLDKLICQPQQ
jgi:hypothetical protein